MPSPALRIFAALVIGLVLVAVGVGLVYLPAGVIVLGAAVASLAALALHDLGDDA